MGVYLRDLEVSLVVADDHTIIRRGMQLIVAKRPRWRVIEASNADELFATLRGERVDVVVLDLVLRGRSGLDILAQVRRDHGLPVLILSGRPEEQYALQAIRAGARGYVQKDASADEILAAIERVALGRIWVSSGVAEQMAGELARGSDKSPHERLSPRELEVFLFIAAGRTMTDIASILQISVKTASTYRARILEKTGFRSNADIVGYAIRAQLI
ncbi:MAG TPA: response regulator transcription factor [Thermoanaerobaculia bacterium]|nr:response regulator transcription factor [Thermoanaerobaculia bacterium]